MACGVIIPLRAVLQEEGYGRILCYPRFSLDELERRVRELRCLGVTALEFRGEKLVSGVPVLGKGCVGIVVIAHLNHKRAALKIRRVDADRSGMEHEAEMLRRANSVGVGPKLLKATENFLLMEFVEGWLLPEWVDRLEGEGAKPRLRRVLRSLLEQCWRLDEVGVDHGELSRAPKHVIINVEDEPYILDFETASTQRRVSNVTSLCQYLFISGGLAEKIQRVLGKVDREGLISALRAYKRERTRERFRRILKVCGLL